MIEGYTLTPDANIGLIVVGLIAALIAILSFHEYRKSRRIAILSNIYERIEETSKEREIIFNEQDYLRNISEEEFKKLKKNKRLYSAIKKVLNCYEYVGLLVKQRLIEEEKILEKESQTIISIWEINHKFVDFSRRERCSAENKFSFYAMYFQDLYIKAKYYQAINKQKWEEWQDLVEKTEINFRE